MVKSQGFSLIEVLVALVVLAVGLLGLAGLQLKGLQSAHVAYQRTLATLAAQDAGERLWQWQADQRIAGASFACPDAKELDAMQQAWHAQWQDVLPGFAQSALQPVAPCGVVVTAEWRDARFAAAENDAPGESVARLTHVVRLPNG